MNDIIPIEATLRRGKTPGAARRRCILAGAFALFVLTAILMPYAAAAQAVRGEATLNTANGYGRIVFRLTEEVEARVRVTGNVLTIFFQKPVDVQVDRINVGASDYIGAARRDPDGRAIRFALARKFKVNSITASERLYVDLIPESWSGELPGLPQEVVEELARRTREAEKDARERAQLAQLRKIRPVTVRVAKQPTFTRYIFELPELTGVTTDRIKDGLTLRFARPLRFDLADAKLIGADGVSGIDTSLDLESSQVTFKFSAPVDVRNFREDFNFVVDVSPIDVKPPAVRSDAAPARPGSAPGPLGVEPPQTVPVKSANESAPPAKVTPSRPSARVMPGAGAEQQPDKPQAVAPAQPNEKAEAEKVPAGERASVSEQPEMAAKPETAKPDTAKPDTAKQELAKPETAERPVAERPKAPERRREAARSVVAELRRQGDGIRLQFPFSAPTPAAIFQRAQTVWLVFDSTATIDIAAISADTSRTLRGTALFRSGPAQVLQLKLARPRLVSAASEGTAWMVAIGDQVEEPTKALGMGRNIVGPSRTSVTIPFEEPGAVHRIEDPEAGDALFVVTGAGPARGFVKAHEFIEFKTLATTHGVAIQQHADDLAVTIAPDKIEIGRPRGLTLSESPEIGRRISITRSVTFDRQLWDYDRDANFAERQRELITGAASAPPAKRSATRLDLARFYLARALFTEAKAVLDVVIQDDRTSAENPTALVLRSFANIMLERADPALKDLAHPLVGNQHDAQLWRALAYVLQRKWSEARAHFRDVDGSLEGLPVELQRIALQQRLRAAVAVGDFAGASAVLNDLETIGVSPVIEPGVAVLTGRLAEGLGRSSEALAAYRAAAASSNRMAAAQGRLREIALRHELGEASRAQIVQDLESLSVAWRGDEIELETLQFLGRLYTDDQRYRDAFQVMRTALVVHPSAEVTRAIHEDAAATFDALFLEGKGELMPPIDALSLFYDFRDLTPPGRRGDEMIRRLADRLVAVDLLDPAAELLQHQVDNRLQGAARAQVATRLAVIYLLNRKPAEAHAALRGSRSGSLSNEIRNQRLLIEARALSDLGRHDLALEVIANVEGRQAVRLRGDIHWAAKRWQQAAEQIELHQGDRWKTFEPLAAHELADVLRAGIGYALADDAIGLGRLRERYAGRVAEGKDRQAFDAVVGGLGTGAAEFRDAARLVASADTLDGFLREMQERYPEMNVLPAQTPGQPVAGQPMPAPKPDPDSTGSIAPRERPQPVRSRAAPR